MARPERVRLGDLLIQEGLLTSEQLTQALEEQRRTGRKLGRMIVDNGLVTEEQVSKALAKQLRMPFMDVGVRTLRPELVKLLPEVQARRLRSAVLEDTGVSYKVMMADPTDINAYDELGRLLKRDIEVVVVTETKLLAAIDRSYQRTDQIAGLAKELTSELSVTEGRLGDMLGLGNVSTEDAPVVKLLSSVFEEALRVRASDIHIEPQERSLRIRFRIDGVLHVQTEADPKIANAVALRLKLMSGLDISEKRLPQDGRFHVKLSHGAVDVRISTLPAQYGESVVMRLLNQNAGLLELQKLNLPPAMLDALERAIAKPSGMVLVTGPTGSGKTTTLYAALNQLNTTDRKILTAEDPVEYRLPGLNQVQVQEKIDLSFDRVLRAALRQDPDIVLIGEMRDQKTAEIGMRAAMTGHLVLSTLHTNSAAETITRLLDMGMDPFNFADSLLAVLAQRLVRRQCPKCLTSKPATSEQVEEWLDDYLHAWGGHAEAPSRDSILSDWLQRFGKDGQLQAFHSPGCDHCDHTGVRGRAGIHELLTVSRNLRRLVQTGSRAEELHRQAMIEGMHTLRQDGLEKMLQGITSIEEVRATSNV